jgi:acyl carrier protein
MNTQQIENIVVAVISEYCKSRGEDIQIDKNTPLIGSNSILDSLGLVNVIVDIEAAFMDENVDVTLASESAMSSRISPFRSVGSICAFIAGQLETKKDE